MTTSCGWCSLVERPRMQPVAASTQSGRGSQPGHRWRPPACQPACRPAQLSSITNAGERERVVRENRDNRTSVKGHPRTIFFFFCCVVCPLGELLLGYMLQYSEGASLREGSLSSSWSSPPSPPSLAPPPPLPPSLASPPSPPSSPSTGSMLQYNASREGSLSSDTNQPGRHHFLMQTQTQRQIKAETQTQKSSVKFTQ